MTNNDQQLLDYIQQMADDAPSVGLCALPFELLKERVALVIEQKDWLLKHRIGGTPLPADNLIGR